VSSQSIVNRFSSADAVLLETLSRHTGAAIERSRGLKAVEDIGRKILRAREISAVLTHIVNGAITLTRTDNGVIYLLSEDGLGITHRFHPPGFEHPMPRLGKEDGTTRKVIAKREIVEISDISSPKAGVHPALVGLFHSMAAVPLVREDDRVIGVLYLNFRNARTLTNTEKGVLMALARQATSVIERTRLDAQLRDSEAMYRSLVDHIPQSVFRKDRNLRFTFANAQYCARLGRSLDQVLGKSVTDFYTEDMAEGFARDDRHVLSTRRRVDHEEVQQTKDLRPPVLVHIVKTPVLDASGDVTGVQGIFWDVTDERRAQERYRLLVEQSPDAIVLHKAGLITLANPAAWRLFGAETEDDLKGRSIVTLVHPEDRSLAEERLAAMGRGESVREMVEMRVLRAPDLETVHVEVRARVLPLDTRLPVAPGEVETQVVFHELTRVRTLLREMHHRVNRALSVVSGVISDQVLITADSDTKRAFVTILRRIEAVAILHRRLHIDQGPVLLREYLEAIVEKTKQIYPRIVDVDVDVSRDIAFDENRTEAIGQVVHELVANSLFHGFDAHDSGHVSVRFTETSDHLFLLAVRDDGRGAARLQPRGDGSGLGIVSALVEDELGGTCEIKNGNPGVIIDIAFTAPVVAA
jgi:PAS domain S-box-containing protein